MFFNRNKTAGEVSAKPLWKSVTAIVIGLLLNRLSHVLGQVLSFQASSAESVGHGAAATGVTA